MKPGDVVVVSRVNANRPAPAQFFLQGRLQAARVDSRVPLRLMSGWGFLPFALSLEPVDEFLIRTPN